jgi:hypothetical protein
MRSARREWLKRAAAMSATGVAASVWAEPDPIDLDAVQEYELPVSGDAQTPTEPETPVEPDPAAEIPPGKPIRIWDGKTGATGGMFNDSLKMPWRNRGGDWIDANGIEQGPTPYATMVFGAADQEVDITALAREWFAQGTPNSGAYLRVTNPVALYTRRHVDATLRPALVLISASGARTIVPCAASAMIQTASNTGKATDIAKLSSTTHMALQFDLTDGSFAQARLRLHASYLYSKPCTIDVYELDQPMVFNSALHKPVLGIAAAHPKDVDIVGHPDVYVADDFTPKNDWRAGFWDPPAKDTTYQHDGPRGGIAAHSQYRKGSYSSGLSLKRNWTDVAKTTRNPRNDLPVALEIPPSEFLAKMHQGCPEDLYFRYYFMAKPGYQCGRQGKKLPGLAGQYGRWLNTRYAAIDGNGGAPTSGRRQWHPDGYFYYSGWSMRHHAAVGAYDDSPHARRIPLSYYAYHAQMAGPFGDNWYWGNHLVGWCVIEEGKWYCFEHRIKMNSIAGPHDALGNGIGQPDGIVQGWLDGVLVFDRRDVVLRHHPAIKIDCLWLNHYHGGKLAAERDHPFAMANMVVARRYIGPMVG